MSKLVRRGTKLPKSEVHNATKRGNMKELAKLLKSKKGYTVEDRSPKSNRTPLHIAARKGSERNPLQSLTFCLSGHLAIVKELLRKFRVNINALDNKKRTPLHLAIQYGHHEIALLLISKQANVSLQDVDGGFHCFEKNSEVAFRFQAMLSCTGYSCIALPLSGMPKLPLCSTPTILSLNRS